MRGTARIESATCDVDEAEALMRAGGSPTRIEPGAGSGAFEYAVDLDLVGDLAFCWCTMGGEWTLASEIDGFYVLAVEQGAVPYRTAAGEGRAVGGGPVLLPPGGVEFAVEDRVVSQTLQFDRRALAARAAAFYDVEDVRLLHHARELSDPAHEELWRHVLRYTRAAVEAGLLRERMLRSRLEDNLVATVLSTFAPVTARLHWRCAPGDGRRLVRVAKAFIEERAAEPVAPIDVARAAGVPLPLLEEAFRAQRDESVADFLRTVRLDGARSELLRTPPTSRARGRIARRWGFPSESALRRAVHDDGTRRG